MSRRIHCSLVAVIVLTQTLLPVMSYAQGPVGRATLDGAAFSSSASINEAGYLYFKGDFGDRIGSNGPVFSAGAFLPYFLADETVAFADARIAINEGELGYNGGLGLRTIFGNSAVAGGSFWVDTQDSQNGAHFTQLGVSGEMLLNRIEFRANGYFNVGRERNNFAIGQTGRFIQAPNGVPSFVDIQWFETSPSGGDVEVGVPLPGYEWLSLHAGGYFYDEVNGDEITGVRVRLEAQVSDDIMWELRYTNDEETGSSLNASVSMLLSNRPLGLVPRYQRQGPQQRLVRQVVRQYRPAIFIEQEDILVPAVAPGGGPLGIVVIDASAPGGGTGTFADPLNAFNGSNPNASTFFVRNGGTSATNPLISSFNLLPGQSLIGEGQTLTVNTSRGVFTIPGTGGGMEPFITHPTGDVVTLSNNNTVNGINFISSTGNSAISGANISTPLNIQNATFAGTGGGLNFTNLSGPQNLSNLAFAMDPNASGAAINVANTNVFPLQFNVSDTSISGGLAGISLSGNNSNITSTLNNVTGSGSGDGLVLNTSNGGNINITKNGGSFNNTTGNGTANGDAIVVNADSGSQITFNTFNSNFDNAFRDIVNVTSINGSNVIGKLTDGSALTPGRRNLTNNVSGGSSSVVNFDPFTTTQGGDNAVEFFITDNSFGEVIYDRIDASGAMMNGVFGIVDNNSTGRLTILGSNFNNAGLNGLDVTVSDNSFLEANIVNSTFNDAQGGSGIKFNVDNQSRLNLTMNNNRAVRARDNGLNITSSGNSVVTINSTSHDYSGSGLDGVQIVANAGSVQYNDTTLFANNVGGNGVSLSAQNNAFIGATMNNVQLLNAGGGDGINVMAQNLSRVELTANNVTATGANVNGLDVSTMANSQVVITNSMNNFSNANQYGVRLAANMGSISYTSTDLIANGALSDGLLVNGQSNSFILTDLTNSQFNNAGGDAIHGLLTGRSRLNMTLDNTMLNMAGGDGVELDILSDSDLNATISNAMVNNASGDAFNLNIDGAGSTGILGLSDSSANGAGGDGFQFNASNRGQLTATITNTTFDMASGNGFLGTVHDPFSIATLNLTDVTANNAGLQGFGVKTTNGGTLNATLVRPFFDDAGRQGISLFSNNANLTFNASGAGSTQRAGIQGLDVQGTAGATIDVDITDGSFDNAGNDGVQIYSAGGSNVDVNLSNTSANMSGNVGLDILTENTNSISNITITNGGFDNATGDGITLNHRGSGTTTLTTTGTSANMAGIEGLDLDSNGSGIVNVNITNGGFNNATGDGISLNHVGTGTTWLTLNGTSANMPGLQGLDLDASGLGTVNVNITNGGFDDAINGDAINIRGQNSSTINFTMLGTTAERAGADGFEYDILSGSTFVGSITNGSFNNSTFQAIDGTVDGTGSSATLTVENTDGNNSGGGLILTALTSATMNTTVNNSDFNNSTSFGLGAIGQFASSGANASLTLNNVNALNAAGNGVDLTSNNGQIDFTYNGGDITGANGNAFNVDSLFGGTINTFNVTNVLADNAGTFGFDLNANNGTFNGTITGGSLTNAGQDMFADEADALNISAIDGSNVNLTINDTPLNDTQTTATQENSVLFDVRSGSTLDLNILNTVATPNTTLLSNNLEDGVNGFITGNGSTVNLTLDGARVDDNGDDGLDFNLEDQGTLNLVFNSTNNQGTIHGNGDDGVAVRAVGAGGLADTPATLTFNGIEFSANGGQSVDLNPQGEAPPAPRDGGSVNLIFNNSVVNNFDITNIIVDDPNSPVSLHFNNTSIAMNPTGPGIGFNVSNGGDFTLSLENLTISGNGAAGIAGVVDGVNPGDSNDASTATLIFKNINVTNNAEEGFELDITNGGQVTYTNSANYSNNGTSGNFSGMRVQVTDPNSSFNGTFLTSTASNNTKDGFEFIVSNDGNFTANMDTTNANLNVGDGIHLDASNANNVDLILTGLGTRLLSNGDSGLDVVASNLTSLDLGLTGLASGNTTGDAMSIVLDDIATGTIIGRPVGQQSTMNGIDISITDSTFTNIAFDALVGNNNTAGDGVVFNLDNAQIGNFDSNGLSTSNNLRGFVVNATNGTTISSGDILGTGGLVSSNTNQGVLLNVDDSNVNFDLRNSRIQNNGAQGVRADVLNGGIFNGELTGNTISGNQIGVDFVQDITGGAMNVSIGNATLGNLINNNTDQGASLEFNAPLGSTFGIRNTTFGTSPAGAIRVQANNNTGLNNSTISGNTISNRGDGDATDDAIFVEFNDTAKTFNFNIANNTISNSTNGIDIDVNGTVVNGVRLAIDNNTVSGSTVGAGLDLNVPNGLVARVESFDGNTFSGNAGGGSSFHVLGGNGAINFSSFDGNTYTGNTGNAVSFDFQDTDTRFFVASFDNNIIQSSTGNGVDISITDNILARFNSFDGNTISGNVDGVRITAPDSSRVLLASFDGNTLDMNTDNAVDIDQTGTSSVIFESFGTDASPTTISGSGGAGFDSHLADNSLLRLNSIVGSNFTGNNGGLNFDVDDSSRLEINEFTGNNVSNNTNVGLFVDAFNQTSFVLNIGDSTANQNTFNANVDAGLGVIQPGTVLGTVNQSTGTLTIVNSTFSNTTNSGTNTDLNGDGVGIFVGDLATLDNVVVGDAALNNTSFTGNAGAGFDIDVAGNGTSLNPLFQMLLFENNLGNGLDVLREGDARITGGIITDVVAINNLNGVSLVAQNANATDDYVVTNNTLDNNNANGLIVEVQADADIVLDIRNNTFRDNGANGFLADELTFGLTDSASIGQLITAANPTGEWFANTFTGNGQNGAALNATFTTIQFGEDSNPSSLGTADNLFSNNNGSGLTTSEGGTLIIEDADFIGNGVDGARITGGGIYNVQNSIFTGNGDDGSEFLGNGSSVFQNNIVTNNGDDGSVYIGNVTATFLNNVTTNNGGDGAFVTGTGSFIVQNNTVTDNGGDGLFVSGPGTFNIDNSTITGNGQDGLDVANRSGSINFNTIANNGNDGLELTSNNHDIFNNIVRSNQANGFNINGNTSTNRIINNQIVLNQLDGVQAQNGNLLVIGDEDLNRNGVLDAGEDFDNDGRLDAFEDVNGNGNLDAGEDTDGDGQLDTGNFVRFNGGRGVEIINAGTNTLQVNIDGNSFRDNEAEAIYVINTADNNSGSLATLQNSSVNTLTNQGSVFNDPRLAINVDGNLIRDNGLMSTFDGAGLVIRGGTSDSSTNIADNGGFASTGFDTVSGILRANRFNSLRGGIASSITNNRFSGNFGDDIYFDIFNSTVGPNTTGGAWTDQNTNPRNNGNDVFNPSGFQTDPLVRWDANVVGNTGDGISVLNFNQGGGGAADSVFDPNFDNPEAVFKSRTQNQDNGTDGGADDNGPFANNQAGRVRFGTRQAGRGGAFASPTLSIGNSDNFLFPSLGASTLRVTSGTQQGVGFTEPSSTYFGNNVAPAFLTDGIGNRWERVLP